ncbi:MAG: type II toxin-antitoxin system VapC family toxin [Nitrospirae bacterium]|nr:type II toxin-antitoxin system VapC family toxin [Nitrospirota bacterium]MBI3378414.1 type II toxin-antitoxin system VapC family toxin [Nitrospirota bacterium]
MIVYLDTSSLVKLYVEEAGSAIVRDVTQKASVIAASKIAYAEARAAFARKQRDDGFSITALRKIVADLNRDWESYFIIEVTDGIIRSAGDIAEKYLLRGFDSIHLASAVNLKGKILGEVYFSSTDAKLNRAAGKEGIKVL